MSEFIKSIHYSSEELNSLSSDTIECILNLDTQNSHFSLFKDGKLLSLQSIQHYDKDVFSFADSDFKKFEMPPYKSLKLCLSSSKFTLIPTEIFDSSNIEAYINFNFEKLTNEVVFHESIDELGITAVYTISTNYHFMLKRVFANLTIENQKTFLLKKILSHNASSQNIYLHTRKDCFDIFIFNNNTLLFYNSFNYKTAKDYIYYLMQVIKQLELSPEIIKVFLSGEINEDGAIYELLNRYIRHLFFIRPPEGMDWQVEDMPYHYFNNVLP